MATKKTVPTLVTPTDDGAFMGGDASETECVTVKDLRAKSKDGLVEYGDVMEQDESYDIILEIVEGDHNSLTDPKNFLRHKGNVAVADHDGNMAYVKNDWIYDDMDNLVGFIANGKVVLDGEMVINGDVANSVPSDARISFTVLASLIAGEDCSSYSQITNLKYVFKNWSDIKIVDFTGDEVKTSSDVVLPSTGDLRGYNRKSGHAMHKRGYSLVHVRDFFNDDRHAARAGISPRSTYMWHKPATFVITYKKNCYVLGQDEGTYFGSQLPAGSKPKNIAEAFTLLAPPEARGVAGVLRQGEWFAIPAKASDVPSMFDTSRVIGAWTKDDDYGYQLPRDSEDSAIHRVDGEVMVTADGRVFAKNFTMTHSRGEHADMETSDDKWYYFKRNTSVANYSSQGMD